MSLAKLEPEQELTIKNEIAPLEIRALEVKVKSAEDRAGVVEEVKAAEALMKHLEDKFHPTANKVKARELWDAAIDTEKKFYDPIKNFIEAAKKAVRFWDTEETKRIKREQEEAAEKENQRLAEEKAKKDAEAEAALAKEDADALAEFTRIENEKKEKQGILDAATSSGNTRIAGIAAKEVTRLDNELQKAEESHEKKVEEIVAKSEEVAPEPAPRFNRPVTVIKKLVWKAKVTNMTKLCRQIGEGNVPFDVVEISQSRLNSFAKAHDGKKKIEGLEFYEEATGRL